MNNPSDGNGGGWGIRQPSQRETMTGGYAGEFSIPIIQSFAAIVFGCSTVLSIWILIFTIGPDVLWLAGFAVIILVASLIMRQVAKAQRETQEEINGRRAMTIGTGSVALTLAFMWLFSRPFCVSIWPIVPPTFSPWRVIFGVSFILVPTVVCAFMAVHFLIEAYNPAAFQPHQAKPAGTSWWSPTGQYIEETEPYEDEPKYAQIVEVPRPIPAYGANPNRNYLQEKLTDASERTHRTPPEPIRLPDGAFKAPNGRIARIEDLAEFLTEGVTVGATFAVWHKRKGWRQSYWQALVGTCSQHGLAKPATWKSKTRLTIMTKDEARNALEHLKWYLFRDKLSPCPTQETIIDQNGEDML